MSNNPMKPNTEGRIFESRFAVFVGGPWDGERRELDYLHDFITVSDLVTAPEHVQEREHYRLQAARDKGRYFPIYIHSTIPADSVMPALLSGYRQPLGTVLSSVKIPATGLRVAVAPVEMVLTSVESMLHPLSGWKDLAPGAVHVDLRFVPEHKKD